MSRKYFVKNKGKGTYGTGNPIVAGDLMEVGKKIVINEDDPRLSNLASDLSEAEKTVIKDKIGVTEGGGGTAPIAYTTKTLDIYSAVSENAPAPLNIPSYDGSNQGTHPSVVHFPEGWNGYNYWMAYTPYPNANDDFENPCILASNDKINWVVPAGLTNPIEPAPLDGTYYADTHLIFDETNNRLICYWRGFASGLSEFYTWAKTSTDGINWGVKVNVLTETNGGGSPTIIKRGENFEFYDIDFLNNPHRIFKRISSNPLDFNSAVEVECTFEGIPAGQEIWHFDVYNHNGTLYSVMTTTAQNTNGTAGDLLFGVVENNHFRFIGYPFLERETGWTTNRLYRGSISPDEITDKGILWNLWYSAVNGSNQWFIGYTQIKTYYPETIPRFLPKYVKNNITLHDFHYGKTLIIQGNINITVPNTLKKGFQFGFDVLLNSNLNFIPASGVAFSGSYAAAGNKYGEIYELSRNVYRFAIYGTVEGAGGGTTIDPPTVSVSEAETSVIPSAEHNPTGIYFNPSGTSIYVSDIGTGGGVDMQDKFLQYNLTTPFDLTTMQTPPATLSVGVQFNALLSIWVKGNVLLASNGGTLKPKGINQYVLSQAEDVTSATFERNVVFPYPTNPRGLQFSADGYRLFVSAMDTNIIFQYALTEPFNIGTAGLETQYESAYGTAGFPAIYMSNNGKTLIACDFNNKRLSFIRMDTPYNLSTVITELTALLGNDNYSGMYVKEDETKVYLLNYTARKIEQRSLNLNV